MQNVIEFESCDIEFEGKIYTWYHNPTKAQPNSWHWSDQMGRAPGTSLIPKLDREFLNSGALQIRETLETVEESEAFDELLSAMGATELDKHLSLIHI